MSPSLAHLAAVACLVACLVGGVVWSTSSTTPGQPGASSRNRKLTQLLFPWQLNPSLNPAPAVITVPLVNQQVPFPSIVVQPAASTLAPASLPRPVPAIITPPSFPDSLSFLGPDPSNPQLLGAYGTQSPAATDPPVGAPASSGYTGSPPAMGEEGGSSLTSYISQASGSNSGGGGIGGGGGSSSGDPNRSNSGSSSPVSASGSPGQDPSDMEIIVVTPNGNITLPGVRLKKGAAAAIDAALTQQAQQAAVAGPPLVLAMTSPSQLLVQPQGTATQPQQPELPPPSPEPSPNVSLADTMPASPGSPVPGQLPSAAAQPLPSPSPGNSSSSPSPSEPPPLDGPPWLRDSISKDAAEPLPEPPPALGRSAVNGSLLPLPLHPGEGRRPPPLNGSALDAERRVIDNLPDDQGSTKKSSGLSDAVVIAIAVVASVGGAGVAALGTFLLMRRYRRTRHSHHDQEAAAGAGAAGQGAGGGGAAGTAAAGGQQSRSGAAWGGLPAKLLQLTKLQGSESAAKPTAAAAAEKAQPEVGSADMLSPLSSLGSDMGSPKLDCGAAAFSSLGGASSSWHSTDRQRHGAVAVAVAGAGLRGAVGGSGKGSCREFSPGSDSDPPPPGSPPVLAAGWAPSSRGPSRAPSQQAEASLEVGPGLGAHGSSGGSQVEAQQGQQGQHDGGATYNPLFQGVPSLPAWFSGEIRPEQVQILARRDGVPWMLGRGACGTVYKGLFDGVQPVAVKVVQGVSEQRMRDAFLREVLLLRGCRDRNVVQFIGACLSGPHGGPGGPREGDPGQEGEAMLVTEFMELGDLWKLVPLRGASGQRVFGWHGRGRRVALDVARGLHYLHSRKVVHLDLKSANILIARSGTAKLADVGFSRVLSQSHLSFSGAGAYGTFPWSAPEVLQGQRATGRSDIYSWGVVLWEIATGLTPVRGDMRDLRVPEECPAEVADLYRRCTAPEPASRPTAREVVGVLQQLEEGGGGGGGGTSEGHGISRNPGSGEEGQGAGGGSRQGCGSEGQLPQPGSCQQPPQQEEQRQQPQSAAGPAGGTAAGDEGSVGAAAEHSNSQLLSTVPPWAWPAEGAEMAPSQSRPAEKGTVRGPAAAGEGADRELAGDDAKAALAAAWAAAAGVHIS
ncbi:hypothetical protein N2152v2_007354 [Parachlorella kessleri]